MKQSLLRIALAIISVFTLNLSKAQDSLNISMLYNWNDSTIPGTSAYDNPYNEIWGYSNESGEYAIIGSTMGTHIFDVSDVDNISQVAFVEGAATGSAIVHRDYDNYNNYLYMVCQEGPSTLQIADMSYLPDSVHVIYDDNEFIKGAHNIFIDSTSAKLYCMDVYPSSGSFIPLRILSIEDPEAPTLLHDMSPGNDVHDIYVRNDTGFLNMGWGSALYVYDFSDTENPDFLGSLDTYIGQGYNHSGWLSDDGNTYVMGDETHGSPVKVLDVSDLSDMEIIATMSSDVDELSIPHNQIIKGNLIYSSYYYDGIYVWDIEDPENPALVGFYDTCTLPNSDNYKGCWGVYPFLPSGLLLVSDMQNGLFVLEMDETVGLNDVENSKFEFTLYPNPANEYFYVSFDNPHRTKTSIAIYSISGRLIQRQETDLNTTRVSTENLTKGVYFVELNGNGKATKKLIIN